MTLGLPQARFHHLRRLTDQFGLVEHAEGGEPSRRHGYCTDDAARAAVLTCQAGEDADTLTTHYLGFVVSAVSGEGSCHNRLSPAGVWTDEPGLGDWWGRAIWALGVAISQGYDDALVRGAFDRLLTRRSPYRRAMAYAALGAACVADTDAPARSLLEDAMTLITRPGSSADALAWAWPEARLLYDNASLPLAVLLAGTALARADLVRTGLGWLEFLVRGQVVEGHLSVVPVAGRGPGQAPPDFDQQPIELACLAEAAAVAHALTGGPEWRQLVGAAAAWFVGSNDTGVPMFDPDTGAGYDGLTRTGRNANRGAESTIAANSTLLQAHRLDVGPCRAPTLIGTLLEGP